MSTCYPCSLPSMESRRLPLALVKIQKTPIIHVPVSAILGAAENAESAPAGSHRGSSGSQARAGASEAAPCQTLAKALAPPGTCGTAIYMVANKQRGLAQIPFIVKKRCFLPHTSNGCSGGPWAEPAGAAACTCLCRRRLGNQHGTQQCSSPAMERACPVQMMYLCK